MKRVVIVGGGVTGLAVAKVLLDMSRAHGALVSTTVVERATRLGGNVVTEHEGGFVVDGGPDSWVATKPYATQLAKSVGLEEAIMPTAPSARRVYIAWGGRLHAMPEGLVLGIPTQIRPMAESRLFSIAGKARMALEPFLPAKSWGEGEDESIADFITRRLGQEVTFRLAAPLLGGIFAGDASNISVRAAFPQLVDAERRHGSLIRAMREERAAQRARAAASPGKAPSVFLSLRSGMGSLVGAMTDYVAPSVRVMTGVEARDLGRLPAGDSRGRWAVTLGSGETLYADDVVLATPAHVSARLVRGVDGALVGPLEALPYVSTATVFLAFRRADVAHPLDGSGFIVPRSLGRPLLAATWVSSKWESRAPEGHVLMRAFFGGAWGEGVLERTDEELAALARGELSAFMGELGEPLFTRVFRFARANPQPAVGHLVRLGQLRAALERAPGLHLAASGLDGVGIPDCIRQAAEAAERVVGQKAS